MTSLLGTPELDAMQDWEDLCFNTWPLTCVHCDSTDVIVSEYKDDALCLECGRWQMEEEE